MNDLQYCYPNTDILINIYNIRDQERLNTLERKLTMLRILDLIKSPLKGNFDLVHLCKIHEYIFQDLYTWAGKLRTVEIAKGNMFCRSEYLLDESSRIFREVKESIESGALKSSACANSFAYIFSEINALHPFREGNGRAQREFIRELALSQGYLISFSAVSAEEMLYASKESFLCNYKPMEEIFEKCLSLSEY